LVLGQIKVLNASYIILQKPKFIWANEMLSEEPLASELILVATYIVTNVDLGIS
jgi:hypothetical protein